MPFIVWCTPRGKNFDFEKEWILMYTQFKLSQNVFEAQYMNVRGKTYQLFVFCLIYVRFIQPFENPSQRDPK